MGDGCQALDRRVEVKGRDARTEARRVALISGALRDGTGWRRITVTSAACESVRLYVAQDEDPRMVRTEVAGKKYLQEQQTTFQQVSW